MNVAILLRLDVPRFLRTGIGLDRSWRLLFISTYFIELVGFFLFKEIFI